MIDRYQFSSRFIRDVSFSPDGRTLALVASDGVELWDIASRQTIATLAGSETAAFSPDGQTIAAASDDGVTFWRTADGSEIGRLEPVVRAIQSITFSPDGRPAAADLWEGNIYLWQGIDDSEPEIWEFERSTSSAIVISPNGRFLAIAYRPFDGSSQSYVQLRQVEDGRIIHTIELGRTFTNEIAFSPDSRLIAVATADGTMVFDVDKWQP